MDPFSIRRVTSVHDASERCDWIKDEQTGEWVPHIKWFGIGFGQHGYWGNKHFATLERAEAEYQKHVKGCHESYAAGGEYVVVDIDTSKTCETLLKGCCFINIRKDKKRGKIIHTLHLYRIERCDEEVAQIRKYIPNAK